MPKPKSFVHEHLLIHPVDFFPEPTNPALDFLIQDFLPAGYLALLASEPKLGKTCLATAMALAVASGTDFAGLKSQRANVLWLALEESVDERAQALRFASNEIRALLQLPSPPPAGNPNEEASGEEKAEADRDLKDAEFERLLATPRLYQSFCSEPIDDPNALPHLKESIEDLKIRLLVVDPLHAATTGHSLYDGWAARRTLMGLKRLCAETGCAALVLHHVKDSLRRGARVAESQQLSATASMFMVLTISPSSCAQEEGDRGVEVPAFSNQTKSHNSESTRVLSLACRGRGLFANRTFHFESKHPLDYRFSEPPTATPPTMNRERSEVEAKILAALAAESLTAAELIDELDLVPGTVRNAVTRLYNRGEIAVQMWDSGRRRYALPDKA